VEKQNKERQKDYMGLGRELINLGNIHNPKAKTNGNK
jgi:hypothetical protein